MGGTPSSSGWDAGKLLEARVAQVWFWEGAFVRRGIDLKRPFAAEPFLVTDLDLLAIDIDSTLGFRRTIGEVKSGGGKASKPLDRVIWLRGLMEVTQAEAGELTSQLVPSPRVRELAASLRVNAQSTADLERREANLKIEEVANRGIFGVKWVGEPAHVRRMCADDPELERAYWSLCSEIWFLSPFAALNRTLATLRALSRHQPSSAGGEDDFALRWLMCEGTVLATLNLVAIAHDAFRFGDDLFAEFLGERLTTGRINTHQMQTLSRSFDEYLADVLRDVGASEAAIREAMGAFDPRPPGYSAAVAEVAGRLAAGSIHARHLPRWADLMCFERVVRRREPAMPVVARLACPEVTAVARAGRLVANFLKEHAGLSDPVVSALGEPPRAGRTGGVEPTGVLP